MRHEIEWEQVDVELSAVSNLMNYARTQIASFAARSVTAAHAKARLLGVLVEGSRPRRWEPLEREKLTDYIRNMLRSIEACEVEPSVAALDFEFMLEEVKMDLVL